MRIYLLKERKNWVLLHLHPIRKIYLKSMRLNKAKSQKEHLVSYSLKRRLKFKGWSNKKHQYPNRKRKRKVNLRLSLSNRSLGLWQGRWSCLLENSKVGIRIKSSRYANNSVLTAQNHSQRKLIYSFKVHMLLMHSRGKQQHP